MPDEQTLHVLVSGDVADALDEAVAKGEYASSGELVREALQEWAMRRRLENPDNERLRAAVALGIDDDDAGRAVSITTRVEVDALAARVKQRGRSRSASRNSA